MSRPGPPLAPLAGCGVTGQHTFRFRFHSRIGGDSVKAPITGPQLPTSCGRPSCRPAAIAQTLQPFQLDPSAPAPLANWEQAHGASWWTHARLADQDRHSIAGNGHPQGQPRLCLAMRLIRPISVV